MIFNSEVLSLFQTILPGKCQAHAKHGAIQYSLMHFYRNIHTSHARHDQIKRYFALHDMCRTWLCELATFLPCARPQGVTATMANSPSLNSLILHHWWHDRNRAEHGMWRYMWALLAVAGTCLALAWQYGVDQALFCLLFKGRLRIFIRYLLCPKTEDRFRRCRVGL